MADRRAYNRDVQGNWELVRHDPEKADVYAAMHDVRYVFELSYIGLPACKPE